jgi:type I restriction enzyme S subunit
MNWPLKKLSDLCVVKRGTTITQKEAIKGQVPVVGGGTKPTYFHNSANRSKNTITVSGSGASAGFINFYKEPIFASDCSTIEPKNETVDVRYIYRAMQNLQNHIYSKLKAGAAQPHVYAKDLAKLQIPFPPLAEQQRIAELLDTVDKIILGHKKFISILKILINSYFEKLFSDTNNKKKYKVNDFCFVTDYVANGSFASLKKNVKYLDEGFAVLVRLTDYTKNWESSFKYVSKDSFNFLKKSSLNPGDLIMSNVGECGKTFQVPDLKKPMTLGPNSILIRPNPKIAIPEFLVQYFNEFEGKKKLETIIRTTAQKKFNKTDFRNLEIDLPDMPEQQKFLNLLKIINKIKINKINSLIKSKDLINSLNNQLFFRV